MLTQTGDVQIIGALSATSITGTTRAGITQEASQIYPIELQLFRVWDAFQTPLGTAAADDLGITAAAFATGCPYIHSGDLNALGPYTRYARAMFTLPVEYVAGGAAAFRFATGMLTAVASVSNTIDVEAYKSDRDATIGGSDLVTTAAQSMNSTTFAEKTFTIEPSTLAPGSVLDIRIALIGNSATASAHFAAIAHAELSLTVKG